MSVELLFEYVDVVKSAASISLRSPEDHHMNPNSLTDFAATLLPRHIPENPPVNVCMISVTVKDVLVVAEDLDSLCNRSFASIESRQNP